MNTPVACACLLFALSLIHSQGRTDDDKNALSPDGQWRYACVDGHWPEIRKTSTAKRALDLMHNDRSVPHPDGREVVWAPDSKRFAFNYSPPHVPHSTYVTSAFYQLRGAEWVLLHSPIDEESPEKSFAALAKHLPKGVRRSRTRGGGGGGDFGHPCSIGVHPWPGRLRDRNSKRRTLNPPSQGYGAAGVQRRTPNSEH